MVLPDSGQFQDLRIDIRILGDGLSRKQDTCRLRFSVVSLIFFLFDLSMLFTLYRSLTGDSAGLRV
jgi:hypothetical protein